MINLPSCPGLYGVVVQGLTASLMSTQVEVGVVRHVQRRRHAHHPLHQDVQGWPFQGIRHTRHNCPWVTLVEWLWWLHFLSQGSPTSSPSEESLLKTTPCSTTSDFHTLRSQPLVPPCKLCAPLLAARVKFTPFNSKAAPATLRLLKWKAQGQIILLTYWPPCLQWRQSMDYPWTRIQTVCQSRGQHLSHLPASAFNTSWGWIQHQSKWKMPSLNVRISPTQ